MRKNIFTFAIIAIIFVLSSCEKDETQTKASETNDTGLLSIEYKYSDTIRLSNNEQGYVDIVVSSDKEDVLKSHLSKNEYFLETNNKTLTPTVNGTNTENENSMCMDIKNYDIENMPKIRVEVINENNIDKCTIKCLPKQTVRKIQKAIPEPSNVIVYSYPTYYEYSSAVHKSYGVVYYTYRTKNNVYLPTMRVRFGSKDCWLCKVDTWPNGQWGYLHEINGNTWNSVNNSFGKDGGDYQGYDIYRLYTGIYSHSPNSFTYDFGTTPFSVTQKL
jgi:hypothetical protein